MSHTRMEDGLLRTDACFERHNLARKFQYDERESESFSGGERALDYEEQHLAKLHTFKAKGDYIPRYNNMYTRLQAKKSKRVDDDFASLCEKGV